MNGWIPTYDIEGNLIELECPECGITYYINGTEPDKCKCGRTLEYEPHRTEYLEVVQPIKEKQ